MDYATAFFALHFALQLMGWAMLLQATLPFIRVGYYKLKPLGLLQCVATMATYASYVGAAAIDNYAVLLAFTPPLRFLSVLVASGAIAIYSCITKDTRHSRVPRSSPASATIKSSASDLNAHMASIWRCTNIAKTTVGNTMQKLAGLLLYVFWTATAELIGIVIATTSWCAVETSADTAADVTSNTQGLMTPLANTKDFTATSSTLAFIEDKCSAPVTGSTSSVLTNTNQESPCNANTEKYTPGATAAAFKAPTASSDSNGCSPSTSSGNTKFACCSAPANDVKMEFSSCNTAASFYHNEFSCSSSTTNDVAKRKPSCCGTTFNLTNTPELSSCSTAANFYQNEFSCSSSASANSAKPSCCSTTFTSTKAEPPCSSTSANFAGPARTYYRRAITSIYKLEPSDCIIGGSGCGKACLSDLGTKRVPAPSPALNDNTNSHNSSSSSRVFVNFHEPFAANTNTPPAPADTTCLLIAQPANANNAAVSNAYSNTSCKQPTNFETNTNAPAPAGTWPLSCQPAGNENTAAYDISAAVNNQAATCCKHPTCFKTPFASDDYNYTTECYDLASEECGATFNSDGAAPSRSASSLAMNGLCSEDGLGAFQNYNAPLKVIDNDGDKATLSRSASSLAMDGLISEDGYDNADTFGDNSKEPAQEWEMGANIDDDKNADTFVDDTCDDDINDNTNDDTNDDTTHHDNINSNDHSGPASAPASLSNPSRPITFNLGDSQAAAVDVNLKWDDYTSTTAAFHTAHRALNPKPKSPKPAHKPRAASPTQIAALAARQLAASSSTAISQQDKQAAKSRGAAQWCASIAALNAKAAVRDAIVAGLKTQEDVDEYYAQAVDATAADVAAEPVAMTFREEFASLASLVAELEAAKMAKQ